MSGNKRKNKLVEYDLAEKVNIQFPTFHSPQQRLIMNAFQMRGVEEIWVACGTKFGKSLGIAVGLGMAATTTRSKVWRWTAPIYQQAKIGKKYLTKLLPEEPYCVGKESGLPKIEMPFNDNVIEFWHGGDPEAKEGEGVAGDVLDEASKLKAEVYASTKTTVTFTGGVIAGVSTPRGKGWFYQRCMAAKEQMEWALKNGKVPNLIFITAPTSANPFAPKKMIESARKNLPDRLFRQYFLAEFVDDGDVFSGFKDCYYTPELPFVSDIRHFWLNNNHSQCGVVIGVDWAKTVDYTVFTAWTYTDDGRYKMIGFDRFQNVNYVECVKELVRFSRNFKECLMVYHDMTGVGTALDDILSKTNLPYIGVTFTQTAKCKLVTKMQVSFQHGRVELPNWQEMEEELEIYEVRVSKMGGFSYSAPVGYHDDIVSSMILGHGGIQESSGGDTMITADTEDDEIHTTGFDSFIFDDDDD